MNKFDLEREFRLDINPLSEIFKQSGKNYLNIHRNENSNDIFCLSYMKYDLDKDCDDYEYVTAVLKEYVDYLNLKKDKSIVLSEENNSLYKKWKSILLDVTSENWLWYKAWDIFVKSYIKRDKTAERNFYLDEKELYNLYNNNEYYIYIFLLDKLNLTFDINLLKDFILSIWENVDKDSIVSFFKMDITMINNYLLKKGIGEISIENEDTWNDFISFLDNINLKEFSNETLAYFISRKILSLQINPYPIGENEEWYIYNKKEILKKSKTETKLDKTFTNEIFSLALNNNNK